MVQTEKTVYDKSVYSEAAGKYIRKVTWIGLLINLFLSGMKFAAGIFGSSQAVVADAIHSLTDTSTDIAVIIGSHYWSRPPDDCHPYGHRRIETLITIFIGVILLAVGAGIGWEAIVTLHDKHVKPPGWIAFWPAAASVVCKEILYRWTVAVGRRAKSPALVANAWHHRTDAVSSIPACLAVGGALIFPSWTFLDHVGAAFISILILHASLKIIWAAIKELVDAGAPAEIYEKIKTISYQIDAVRHVHGIRTRYISSSLLIDLHIVVDGTLTVTEGHDIAEKVKSRILARGPDVIDVVVHIEPE